MTYYLYVWCSKDGVSRDAGPCGYCEAENDESAIEKLTVSAKELFFHYDQIECTVHTKIDKIGNRHPDSRIVQKFTIRKPQKKETSCCYGCGTKEPDLE